MNNINVLHTIYCILLQTKKVPEFEVRHALTQKSSEMHLVDDFSTGALMWPNNRYLQKIIIKINAKRKD